MQPGKTRSRGEAERFTPSRQVANFGPILSESPWRSRRLCVKRLRPSVAEHQRSWAWIGGENSGRSGIRAEKPRSRHKGAQPERTRFSGRKLTEQNFPTPILQLSTG
jgi:hypothetical protein